MRRYRYSLENHPEFKQGERVLLDTGSMFTNGGIVEGRVVGISSKGIIDMWLVELNSFIPNETYPYTVISVQHTFLIDESKDID
jgi:hypothetical protein